MRIAVSLANMSSMAARKNSLSIRAAVMNCFARCSETDTPYVCLGDFLVKLRSMGWSIDDVEQVRVTVLSMLQELKNAVSMTRATPN